MKKPSDDNLQAPAQISVLTQVLDCQTVVDCLQNHLDTIEAFNVRSLKLFGSVARNEAHVGSDLDFLVEFNGPATFRGYMGFKSFLEDLFHCSVDLVIKKDLKSQIRQRVIEEATLIFDSVLMSYGMLFKLN